LTESDKSEYYPLREKMLNKEMTWLFVKGWSWTLITHVQAQL